jgi:uncharacterized surface protein with fasciclin (FAS1) repeats
VFGPSDAAFGKLPAGTVQDLLKTRNREKLVAILTDHLVPRNVMAADVIKPLRIGSHGGLVGAERPAWLGG